MNTRANRQNDYRYTSWINPTDKTVKLDFCDVANADPGNDGRIYFEIPPLGTVLTQEQLDTQIHDVDKEGKLLSSRLPAKLDAGVHIVRDGVIVGGMAPQLRRLGGDAPRIAPELDPAMQIKSTGIEDLARGLLEKQANDQKILDAAKRIEGANSALEAQADRTAAAESKPGKGK